MSSSKTGEAELKPCPFCGAIPEIVDEDGYEDIECANTACLVQPKALGVSSRPSRETWNTRTSDALQEQLKEAQSELSKAARLINCAGPLDHRVQVMKLDYSNQITALQEQNRKLREALNKIAAWDDEGATADLARYGSYSRFDEPHAVEIARAALKDGQL